MLEIITLPILDDNYAYIVRDHAHDLTAVVDPGDATPVLDALSDYGWVLDTIWITHWHHDHTGGVEHLQQATDAKVIAPAQEKEKIPTADFYVTGGKTFLFGEHEVATIATPGHTMGHVSFYLPDAEAVFTGDALFALGCGRLFEGSAQDGWDSMIALRELPANTNVFFGHEYTESNLEFTLSVDSYTESLQRRAEDIYRLRGDGHPTTPSTIGGESLTNLFMRCDDEQVAVMAGVASADPVEVFAVLREAKNNA